MHRTIKDATVKVYHDEDLKQLRTHVLAFVTAYLLAKHVKALRGQTPFQVICDAWTKDTTIFNINLYHLIAEPDTWLKLVRLKRADQTGPVTTLVCLVRNLQTLNMFILFLFVT